MDTPGIKHNIVMVDDSGLCNWFGQAGTSDTLVYYRGCLARDRSPTASQLPRRDRAELARVARRARGLAEAGLARLAQRRLGPHDYEYQIIVRPRRPVGGNARLARLPPNSTEQGERDARQSDDHGQ